MQQSFFELADFVCSQLAESETALMNYSGEDSDFVRFNHGQVRQNGSVRQRYFTLELVAGNRHASATVTLGGHMDRDRAQLGQVLQSLREQLPHVSDDPHLLFSTQCQSGQSSRQNELPSPQQVLAAIERASVGRDMVGIYAGGQIDHGFANSLGQRNWFSTQSFAMDWSFYHADDKAVKGRYAGFAWKDEEFAARVDEAASQLAMLRQPPRTISPGQYRVYLSPSALAELMWILAWGGFGLKPHRTRSTPLLKMISGEACLSPAVTIRENTAEGIAPNFQSAGFIKPPSVTLIDGGRLGDCLISPRSAKEYGLPTNAAGDQEYPQSLDVAAGELDAADVLRALDTGVYINTLWYLNYSDQPAGRITGLTRFATFWVEGGKIVAPLNVMRFDETVFRVLGENLLGLTSERDFVPSVQTYGSRSTSSIRLPGALVKDFAMTL